MEELWNRAVVAAILALISWNGFAAVILWAVLARGEPPVGIQIAGGFSFLAGLVLGGWARSLVSRRMGRGRITQNWSLLIGQRGAEVHETMSWNPVATWRAQRILVTLYLLQIAVSIVAIGVAMIGISLR